MVDNIGINVLVPLAVFLFVIIGAYMMSNSAFEDVMARRNKQ